MTRVPNWAAALTALVSRYAASSFEWGRTDCLCLVDDVHQAITGAPVAPGEDWRAYTDKRGAMRALIARGYTSAEEVLASYLPPVAIPMAQRGDVGVIVHEGSSACVVCVGDRWFGMTESSGLLVPASVLKAAYAVGR